MTRSSAAPESAYESTSTPITSPRSLRQLSIFFLGATCFLASTAITRRAIYRRNLRIAPKYFEPNTNPHEFFSPAHDAMMALSLATLNCFSVGIMGVGGTLWAFDISGLEEMRSSLRGRLGYEAIYRTDEDTSAETEESLETAILRKREEGGAKNGSNPRTSR